MTVGFDLSPLLVRSAGVAVYQHNLARELSALMSPAELRFVPVDLPRGLAYHRHLLEGKRGEVSPLSSRLPGLLLSARNFLSLWDGGGWFSGCQTVHLAEFKPHLPDAVRVVTTLHDLAVWHHPEWFSPLLVNCQRQKLDYLRRRADLFIAVSHTVAQELREDLEVEPERIAVVHHGVNETFFQEIPVEKRTQLLQRYGVVRPFVLFVGTVEPRKNLPALLAALEMLREQLPPLQLVIAGHRGWKCGRLWGQLKREQQAGRVKLCGGVDGEMLRALYQEALALVYPSFYEGFGLPILEAMASGTPVLASPVPVARELAGEALLLIDPLRPETIAGQLQGLWHEPGLRRDLCARGLALARQLTWRRCAEHTLDLY